MRIETFGEWAGDITVIERGKDFKAHTLDNASGETNFTFNTVNEPEDANLFIRLKPGKTDMNITIKR